MLLGTRSQLGNSCYKIKKFKFKMEIEIELKSYILQHGAFE